MARQIVIDPVTRIEGHAKITIHLGDDGAVSDARFHVTQFRGFEKLCQGRPFHEMPAITARICGICPVSHLIASAKACDALLAVRIPPAAAKLRQVMNLGQLIQSHALSFFHLSSPDLLLGMDADPAQRNIFGLIRPTPRWPGTAFALRQFGQQVIEWLGGKRIHPAWVVPAACGTPSSRSCATGCSGRAGRACHRPAHTGRLQAHVGRLQRGGPHLRQLPQPLHQPGHAGRRPGALRRQDPHRRRPRQDRRGPARATAWPEFLGEAVEPGPTSSSPTTSPRAIPRACIASARWPA